MDDSLKPLRVWWHSDGDYYEFFVDTVDEAKIVLRVLTHRDLQNKSIGYNAGGLEERYEGRWEEWQDKDGLNISEVMGEEERNKP